MTTGVGELTKNYKSYKKLYSLTGVSKRDTSCIYPCELFWHFKLFIGGR